LDQVSLDLRRLKTNILEMPLRYCLDRLHSDELQIIADGLGMAGFLSEKPEGPRETLTHSLCRVMESDGYLPRAVETLPEQGLAVLELVLNKGGTSGDYYEILDTYTAKTGESNSFWAGLRSLMRLGLAFLMHGHHKPYILLVEGLSAVRQPTPA
jgi:hypothetical protein